TITLTKPNGDTETTTVDGNGNWSFDPNPLDNGETGTVTATDPSGNTSGSTSTGVTDKVAPDAPVVDVNGPILSGTGEAGSTITLTKPNGDTETTTVDGNGNWSFDPNPLDNGETGTVTATDPSGNTSGSTSTGVTDKVAPDAPVVDVNGPILSGTGEAGSTITLTKPNGDTETTTVDGNGNWSFDPNPLDNGETGTVTATDP
ncbi:Ig-like domain-containing protein, partial [Wohlfahrtiimonas larvae]|uniref:Ig-like domain-containing protein n=1 Tax=Wohlfahrtiimonas larvae TaxID=1157986 RepID=UPI0031E89AB8